MPSDFWWASWALSALRRCFDGVTVSGLVCLTFGRICSADYELLTYGRICSAGLIVSAWFRSGLLYVFRLGLPCGIPSEYRMRFPWWDSVNVSG
jgi:hypothetical protein